MSTENFMVKLAAGLGQSATIKNVLGEPVQTQNKIIIPVARMAYGFGGGWGNGRKAASGPSVLQNTAGAKENGGEGAGGGGGIQMNLKGVYEVTPEATRFIPAHPWRHVLLGVAAGFLLKAVFFSKRKK